MLGVDLDQDPSDRQREIDERFMQMALREAEVAFDQGEVPIGCVIVKEGRVISRGSNQMESLKDPTAHSEIIAIGAASGSQSDNWRLDDCTLYVTLEPCPMCAGAILNSRLTRVVFGAFDKRLGACGSTMDILFDNPINRAIEVQGGILENQCLGLIQEFFQVLRDRKSIEKANQPKLTRGETRSKLPPKGVNLLNDPDFGKGS